MKINNVSKKIELPADLKKAIDKVRSQLEVNKSELLIVQKARYSESASVEQLIRQRQFLAKEVGDLMISLKELKEEFEIVGKIVDRDKKEVEGFKISLDKLKEESKVIEKEKTVFEQEKEDRAKELEDKKTELSEREAGIIEKELEAEKKLAEFKQFMKKYDEVEQT